MTTTVPTEMPRLATRLVSRVALATGIVVLILVIMAISLGGDTDSPQAFSSHPQSLLSPAYRAFATLDGLGWIFIGAALWALSVLIEPFAPLRSRVVALCGVAQLVGGLGGFTRLEALPDLAARYISANPAQQTALLDSYRTLYVGPIDAMFTTGQIFQAAGFLLVATAALAVPRFPRWLAIYVGLPGVTAGLLLIIDILAPGSSIFFPILLFHIIVGTVALQFVLAARLWRFGPPSTNVDLRTH